MNAKQTVSVPNAGNMADCTLDEARAILKSVEDMVRQKALVERMQSPSFIVARLPLERGASIVAAVVASVTKAALPVSLSIWLNRAKKYWSDKGTLERKYIETAQGRATYYVWTEAPKPSQSECLASWAMVSNDRKLEMYSHGVKLSLFAPVLTVDGLIAPGTDGTKTVAL